MKIEIFIVEDIHEQCTGMTCFETSEYIHKAICHLPAIKGIVIIDGEIVKFSFSPLGMDGDIFTDIYGFRTIIKHLIPAYVFSQLPPANH